MFTMVELTMLNVSLFCLYDGRNGSVFFCKGRNLLLCMDKNVFGCFFLRGRQKYTPPPIHFVTYELFLSVVVGFYSKGIITKQQIKISWFFFLKSLKLIYLLFVLFSTINLFVNKDRRRYNSKTTGYERYYSKNWYYLFANKFFATFEKNPRILHLNGSFTPAIYYAIAILATIRFKNGLSFLRLWFLFTP